MVSAALGEYFGCSECTQYTKSAKILIKYIYELGCAEVDQIVPKPKYLNELGYAEVDQIVTKSKGARKKKRTDSMVVILQ